MTHDVIRSFNRDTAWLATGVLGALVLAALMLGVQEYQPNATQAERDFLLNAHPFTVASLIAKTSSNGKIIPGQGNSVDHAFTDTPLPKILLNKGGLRRFFQKAEVAWDWLFGD